MTTAGVSGRLSSLLVPSQGQLRSWAPGGHVGSGSWAPALGDPLPNLGSLLHSTLHVQPVPVSSRLPGDIPLTFPLCAIATVPS